MCPTGFLKIFFFDGSMNPTSSYISYEGCFWDKTLCSLADV